MPAAVDLNDESGIVGIGSEQGAGPSATTWLEGASAQGAWALSR
jgi:hypothetical protein